jgi:hypothetical protein
MGRLSGARWLLLPVLLAAWQVHTSTATEADDFPSSDEDWLDAAESGSWAPPAGPGSRDFRTIDWLIAAGTTAIVAVCICTGVIALKPWNDASCVACVDGCAFKTLLGQNILDGTLCLVFLAYGIFIRAAHNAHPAVYVPILVVAGVFALLVVLSTVAAKQRSCRCLLPMGSAVGIILALGEVFLGIAAWAKPKAVDSWLADMEKNSPETVPMTVSAHFDAHHQTVAVVLWCFATLQFVRAAVSLVVECHHWRQGRKHAGGYLQAGEDNFYVDGREPADYFNASDYVEIGRGGGTDRK